MKIRVATTFVAVALMAPLPAAAEQEERALSLADCIDLAIQHNLEFESNLKNPEIAAQDVRIARATYDPSFSANANLRDTTSPGGVNSQTNQLFTGTQTARESAGTSLGGSLPTGATWSVSARNTNTDVTERGNSFNNENGFVGIEFRQPLLRNRAIDPNRLGIQLSDLALQDSESQLQNQLMNLVTNVEFAYYDLIAARDRLTIFQQSYDLADGLVKSHQKQVDAGRMAPLDVKQAEAAVASSDAALFAARNQVTEAEIALKLLMTTDFASWADLEISPTTEMQHELIELSRGESWERALTGRPDISQAKRELERSNIRLKFAKNQRYPSLDLSASYALSGTGRDIRNSDTPDYGFGVVFSVPLGNTEARAQHEQQKLRTQQSLIAFKSLEQRVMANVLSAINAVESSAERVQATIEAREFAEVALEAEETKRLNGKSTNFIVLQLQADLTQARLNETLAIVDYNRALATLALREASTLERHGIEVAEDAKSSD